MVENINTELLREKATQTIAMRLKVLNMELDQKMSAYTAAQTTELETQIFDLRDTIRKLEDQLYEFSSK